MAVPLAGGGCREWRRCSLMEEAGEGDTACWWMRQGRAALLAGGGARAEVDGGHGGEELRRRLAPAMEGRSSGEGRHRPWHGSGWALAARDAGMAGARMAGAAMAPSREELTRGALVRRWQARGWPGAARRLHQIAVRRGGPSSHAAMAGRSATPGGREGATSGRTARGRRELGAARWGEHVGGRRGYGRGELVEGQRGYGQGELVEGGERRDHDRTWGRKGGEEGEGWWGPQG